MVRRTIVSLGFALVVAAPTLIGISPVVAEDQGNHNGQGRANWLLTAYPELSQGVLTLGGSFGDGAVTVWIVSWSLSGSLSLASTSMSTGVSSSVVAVSSTALRFEAGRVSQVAFRRY